MYKNSAQGNLELISKTRDSMFSRRQAYYIHGCLNGLFLDKYMSALEGFGYIGKVLYPETLILLVSAIKKVPPARAKILMDNYLPPLEPETDTKS